MTGTAGWAYYAATQYMLGIKPGFTTLSIDPCIPESWDGFRVKRIWRGAEYDITVENPDNVQKGVKALYCDGLPVAEIPLKPCGTSTNIRVVMGKQTI